MVSPELWRSRRFQALPSDDARLLYLYLLTSPHQTSAGCCALPDGYACADLNWPLQRYEAARAQLIDGDMVKFCKETSEVFICRWFNHNLPQNESHRTGIVRLIDRIGSAELQNSVSASLNEAAAARAQSRKARDTGSLRAVSRIEDATIRGRHARTA